jgi:excisionase family DNA binding protein
MQPSKSCGSTWGAAMIDKPWLTVEDAASHAAVSQDTIYTACERGELRHVKVGGRKAIRLRAEWIDGWLERHATGGQRDEHSNLAADVR